MLRLNSHRLRGGLETFSVMLCLLVLTGCGGGASTESLPQTNASPQSNYSGPAPANADRLAFMINVWENLRPGNGRCGECHSNGGGQSPLFARDDDVNLAYDAALSLVNLGSPPDSRLVTKVGGGHNCWLSSAQACADIMTTWIEGWGGNTTGQAGRQINLKAPSIIDVGDSKNFPANAAGTIFGDPVGLHELLMTYCSNCHSPASANPQTPYFADSDVDAAYDAVKSKINLDDPASSRLVVRLRNEFHNCWSECGNQVPGDNDDVMEARIQTLADQIPLTQVDPQLVISKALTLFDGTVASGGNRHEANQIALYEFKAGQGNSAFDTSGVDPAIDLTLSGDVTWVGGWGIDIKTGKAQGSTTASKKLHDMVKSTNEYSIEAWVAPGNVVQEDTRIVSYSAGTTARNFNLGQTLYNYDSFTRSSVTDANGSPGLSTAAADEDLQATLQHVVTTFDPVNGGRIYVNGTFTDDFDPNPGGTLGDWDDTFAFVLGNEVSGDRQWQGVIRLVAIHNRVLTPAQIQQNFDVGVGEKFFLLFFVGDLVGMNEAYILFEGSQFDSYSYLFNSPVFISLDPIAQPGNIDLEGMRIGVNGVESSVGQAYSNLVTSITDASYDPATGQLLSDLGTVVALEKGPDLDEFFLSFEVLGSNSNVFVESSGGLLPPPTPDDTPKSDIGLRTFDEINASMSSVSGIPVTEANVQFTFNTIRQSLPAIESVETFLSSHGIGIAQLAIEYCNALIEDVGQRNAFFPAFNFNAAPSTAYAGTDRDDVIDPLINNMIGQIDGSTDINTQPAFSELKDELGYCTDGGPCLSSCCLDGGAVSSHDNLIKRLLDSAPGDTSTDRTEDIAKGVCAAVLGNGAMLIH